MKPSPLSPRKSSPDGIVRIVVTGTQGQVVSALRERATALGVQVIAVGRPTLDLADATTILPALAAAQPEAIVSAAGYTAVDQAEKEPELAYKINAIGAGEVAAAAHLLGVPVVHLSTDYVFDGAKREPYIESDPVCPLNVYGQSKAAGDMAVAAQNPNHAILRTSWVYSPFGKNFVRTVLRLANNRDVLDIVADQHGAPTSALDIADGIIAVVRNLVARPNESSFRGVFHMSAAGHATWADFGEAVFAASRAAGGPFTSVRRIASVEYPQAAKRPTNSRLNCSRIATVHGVRLPDWHVSLRSCVERIVKMDGKLEAAG